MKQVIEKYREKRQVETTVTAMLHESDEHKSGC